MQRQRGGLGPIGDAVSGLDDVLVFLPHWILARRARVNA